MTDFPIETLAPRSFAFLSRSAAMSEMPATMGAAFASVAEAFARAGAPPAEIQTQVIWPLA